MNTELLKDIGLSDREIKVYIALTDLGKTTTGPLVKESGVPNSKIYEILGKLILKGLVNYVFIGKIKYFEISEPKNIIHFFEEKKEKMLKLVNQIEARKNSHSKQESYIFEGTSGVKAAFNNAVDYLKRGDEICVFSMGEELGTDELRRFWNYHFARRIDKGIKTRAIPHTSLKKMFTEYYDAYQIKYRFSSLKLPMGTFIYKNHVLTLVWGEKPIAFVIKSEKIYRNYMEFFETIWNNCK